MKIIIIAYVIITIIFWVIAFRDRDHPLLRHKMTGPLVIGISWPIAMVLAIYLIIMDKVYFEKKENEK